MVRSSFQFTKPTADDASGVAPRAERGQAAVVVVLFLVVLIGAAAFTIDVGKWFREDRKLQADVDAAALAGAQGLHTGEATAFALGNSAKNDADFTAANISFETRVLPDDTIVVTGERTVDGSFTRVLGINSADVHATAKAHAAIPAAPYGAAPMVVYYEHPMLIGCGGPCFYSETTIELDKTSGVPSVPGAFDLINLDQSGANPGNSLLADWILNGYPDYLPLGLYYQRTGSSFTSSNVRNAMEARIGSTLLFPVVNSLTGNGSNAQYNVIGWAAFYLTDFDAHGNEATISGHFEQVIWDGIQTEDPTLPDFGVRTVRLVD